MSDARERDRSGAGRSLGLPQIITYASPVLAVSFIGSLTSTYYVKYGTDVLMVAPGVIGALWGLSRLWEALCDPLVGFLSDRTRHSLGRRRSWISMAMPALCFFPLMMWVPPDSLSGSWLHLWLGVGTFGLAMGTSAFSIPHAALGVELSPESSDRTRIFATNGVMGALASFAALTLGLGFVRRAEAPREAAMIVFIVVAVAVASLIAVMVTRSREPAQHRGRGGENPLRAYRDVFRNSHALILISASLFIQITYGAMAVVAVYMLQYVIKIPESTEAFMAAYFIPTLLSVAVWVRLTDRFEKRHLWMVCLACSAVAYGLLGILPEGVSPWAAVPIAAFMGFFGGGFFVFEPAIRAEVIDYDEFQTGERKEGVYSAASQIVGKAAGAAVTVSAGVALQASGYQPNVEQTDFVKLVIRILFGGVPALCFAIALGLLFNFKLSRRVHNEIRVELDRRAEASENEAGDPGPTPSRTA